MAVKQVRKIKLFFCYAHEDDALREQLARHLSPLRQIKHITGWFNRNIDIPAGSDWEHEIETQLATADIILLLVSADFFASDYCYSVEMQRALERHQAGTACVIPIILRPVDWEETPIGILQPLPTGKKPVTLWADRDEAWLDVEQGIRQVVRTLLPKHILSRHETSILYSEEKTDQRIQHPVTPSFQETSPAGSRPASKKRDRRAAEVNKFLIEEAPKKRDRRVAEVNEFLVEERVLRDIVPWSEREMSSQEISFFKDHRRQYKREPEELRSNKKKPILALFVVVILLLASSVGIFNIIQYSIQNANNATATAQANTNATAGFIANASRIAYPPKNASPVLDDPLQDNSKGNNWEINDPSSGNCKFINRAYDINTNNLEWCQAKSTDFTNFIYEIQMKIVQGDGGGILFRSGLTAPWQQQGYYFTINQDSSYSIHVYTSGNQDTVLAQGSSHAIHRGLKQINVVAAVVHGTIIELYVNHQRIAVVGSDAFTHGRIGVIVTGESKQTEVIFQNAKVWKL